MKITLAPPYVYTIYASKKLCTPGRVRTYDLRIKSPVLYQLSYGRLPHEAKL